MAASPSSCRRPDRGAWKFSRRTRKWVEVPPRPGAFVVNIGDLMARWTNDRWISTLHRVVIPEDGGAERRQSFAFFHQPNWDAEIVALDACLSPGEAAEISARPLGAVSHGQVQVDDGLIGPLAVCVRSRPALAFPLRLPYMPRHSTGGFYAAPDSRCRSGGEVLLASHDPPRLNRTRISSMALPDFTMRQLLEAGAHFGHQSHRWNPKMAPYIYGSRNSIHIIDLAQTVPLLHQALKTVSDTVAKGGPGAVRRHQAPGVG